MSPRHLVSVFVGCFLGLGLVHCGGKTDECDPAKCSAGNQCIEQDGVTECRLTCDMQVGPTGCPSGYRCFGAPVSYCQALVPQTPAAQGQWGTSCNSLEGVEAAGCDNANGFYCHFDDRNDPNAFCTRMDCQTDRECAGGYYCGSANVIPPGRRDKREIGVTQKRCLKRTYCSPCSTDVDCGPADDGTKQFCVPGANGDGLCTKACTKDTNCADEATCRDFGDDRKLCYPNAEVCVGDGNLCSPCRSDADCAAGGGACVKSRYSTEKTCTVPSKVTCKLGNETTPSVFDCPEATPPGSAANSIVSCVGEVYSEVPENQCSGLVRFARSEDGGYQIGCYARTR